MTANVHAIAPAMFYFQSSKIRIIDKNGEAWFVASDIAQSLGYFKTYDLTRNLEEYEKSQQIVLTLGGHQKLTVINESGLYSAILKSRKPEAKAFKKWVTCEVLPSIRLTGKYEFQPRLATPEELAPLENAIQNLAEVSGVQYEFARNMLWEHFDISSEHDLPATKIPEILQYVYNLSLNMQMLRKNMNVACPMPFDLRNGRYVLDFCDGQMSINRLEGMLLVDEISYKFAQHNAEVLLKCLTAAEQ